MSPGVACLLGWGGWVSVGWNSAAGVNAPEKALSCPWTMMVQLSVERLVVLLLSVPMLVSVLVSV